MVAASRTPHTSVVTRSMSLSSNTGTSDRPMGSRLERGSERRAHGELEGACGLIGVPIPVPRVDQPERHVEYGHDDAELGAGGRAELPQVEALVLRECLAGVVEEKRAHRTEDVEVILGVEQHELVAAD